MPLTLAFIFGGLKFGFRSSRTQLPLRHWEPSVHTCPASGMGRTQPSIPEKPMILIWPPSARQDARWSSESVRGPWPCADAGMISANDRPIIIGRAADRRTLNVIGIAYRQSGTPSRSACCRPLVASTTCSKSLRVSLVWMLAPLSYTPLICLLAATDEPHATDALSGDDARRQRIVVKGDIR